MNRSFIVAIDGPAGAGKSSVAKAIASRLGFALVDTGAIYRCVALAAQRADIGWTDDEKLARLLASLKIDFRSQNGQNRVFLGSDDVSSPIRAPEISRGASVVSARPVVRSGLLDLQRRLARAASSGAVLEGRDIGTVVFPDADIKFFITASDAMRARRRFDELRSKGIETSFEEVLADQNKRDLDDMSRSVAPLRPATDAELVDTTNLELEEVIEQVLKSIAEARL